jgi:molybdopterin-guanine dinucleotide biosynthesis protein A
MLMLPGWIPTAIYLPSFSIEQNRDVANFCLFDACQLRQGDRRNGGLWTNCPSQGQNRHMGHTQAERIAPSAVTGLLLAGGLGRRMGGADKGLVAIEGKPMAAWVLERLRPQVGQVLINANRNLEEWQSYGAPIVSDVIDGFSGPLAGVHAGLLACVTPWLATVPCDSPFFPHDLVVRLAAGATAAGADLAVVRSDCRLQPVFALLRRDLLPSLERFLQGGGRKIDLWFVEIKLAVVNFDEIAAFANINTPEELAGASQNTQQT